MTAADIATRFLVVIFAVALWGLLGWSFLCLAVYDPPFSAGCIDGGRRTEDGVRNVHQSIWNQGRAQSRHLL